MISIGNKEIKNVVRSTKPIQGLLTVDGKLYLNKILQNSADKIVDIAAVGDDIVALTSDGVLKYVTPNVDPLSGLKQGEDIIPFAIDGDKDILIELYL